MSSVKLYCSWFCPFAQRAWISLLHKDIPFEYIEEDPYNKSPEWLAVSPRGLVPCIVSEGKSIYESSVCIEYVHEKWPSGPPLLPDDPYSKAMVRVWSDHISKKIVPHYYSCLMKRTQEERKAATDAILEGIKKFQENIDGEGPFFMGKEFGMVDIMLAPYALRMSKGNVLHHFRDFYIPETEEFRSFQRWWTAVQEVPGFQKTVQPTEKLHGIYQRYADDYAETEVAEAIRKGTALP